MAWIALAEFELRQIAAVRKDLGDRISDFNHAATPAIPAPRLQQIRALTSRILTLVGLRRRSCVTPACK